LFVQLVFMKVIFTRVVLFGWLLLALVLSSQAQGADQLTAVRSAIASGSSRGLAQYLAPTVEVGFDGDKQSYNATHQGASNEGIPYAIGHYVGRNGSYQVFIKLKPKQSTPTVDTLDFTKE
jgi:hypothetical protein